jgi:ATP synthase protein I
MTDPRDKAAEEIARLAAWRQHARDKPPASPLRGVGTFGMIGWSVAAPTVAGVFLGRWLDRVAPQGFSWTIALILGGAAVGGLIAWRWVDQEGGPQE